LLLKTGERNKHIIANEEDFFAVLLQLLLRIDEILHSVDVDGVEVYFVEDYGKAVCLTDKSKDESYTRSFLLLSARSFASSTNDLLTSLLA
jgi:hypothetical protein